MNCTPAAIARASRCWCLPDDRQRAAMLYLACQWVNAGGAPPCTLPTAPVDLGASAGNSQVTLTWPAGAGATGYNIKRALVSGGPYTVIGTSAVSPYVDNTVTNFTTYYYVVSSTNACGESAGNSIESHGRPTVPFSYAPATSIITWTDTNGAGQSGNLAFFNAHADFASVSNISLSSQSITLISNLGALPSLSVMNLFNNAVTTLDVSHNSALTSLSCNYNSLSTLDVTNNLMLTGLVCTGNALPALDLSHNLALTNLSCGSNALTSLDLSHNPALTNLSCSGNALTSLIITGATLLAALDCSTNLLITLDISTNALLTYCICSSNRLTVLAVNTILTNLASAGLTGGTVNTGIQTPAAPPSVGPPNGIVAKAALLAEAPPWTVTTD